ncbi:MAG: HAD hydrolase-like protein [Candidatus Anstonellaceae archaeon]
MTKEMLKAILIDLDDTLYPSTYYSNLARENAIKNMIKEGLNSSIYKAKKELNNIIEKYGSNYLFHFDRLIEKIEKNATYKEKIIAAGIMAYHKTKQKIKTFKNVKKTLSFLKKRYRLYLVSEGLKKKQWEKILRLGIKKYFDGFFITEKKSISFYKKVLKELKLTPQEVLLIGDHPIKDLSYAKKASIRIIKVYNKKYLGKDFNNSDKKNVIKNFADILKILKR